MVSGVRLQVSGFSVQRRCWSPTQGGCMRSNLILFVLVLVNQNFIRDEHEDEYDDEGGSCRTVVQRAKAAHLTSAICLLSSDT